MKEFIDAALFRDIILCSSRALEQNRQLINELNVFPVPDGDTGTNMSLTMGAAATELAKRDFPTLSAAADCAAGAMLRGARGNSGVILSCSSAASPRSSRAARPQTHVSTPKP